MSNLVQKGLVLLDQAFLVFELIDTKSNKCEKTTANLPIIKLSDVLFDLLVKCEKYSDAICLAVNVLLPAYKFVFKFENRQNLINTLRINFDMFLEDVYRLIIRAPLFCL